MDNFFIEMPHTPEDCAHAIELVHIQGYISQFQWGCKAGNHTAVIILEAENEEQAIQVLPPLFREQARVIKLNQYSPEQVREIHAASNKE